MISDALPTDIQRANPYPAACRADVASTESVRAHCVLQTPHSAYGLGAIVQAYLPRIIALGVATADDVDIETLQQRLDEDRTQSTGIYISDVMFGAWARKPGWQPNITGTHTPDATQKLTTCYW